MIIHGYVLPEKNLVNGKDYPIYYGKYKMFETTNQIYIT